MTKYRIPVRVVRPPVAPRRPRAGAALYKAAPEKPTTASLHPAGEQVEEVALKAASSTDVLSAAVESAATTESEAQQTTETEERTRAYRSSEDEDWRARALRLQAEMATYRRRQQRVAREAAQVEQTALIRDVLVVADNLDRALDAAHGNSARRCRSACRRRRIDAICTAAHADQARAGADIRQGKAI
jgi:hypothetical protein